MVVNAKILEICQFVTDCTSFNHFKCFAKCLSCLLTIGNIIIVCLAVRTCTQELGNTSILGLLKLLHEWRACPEITLAEVAKCHELVDTQVVLSCCLHTSKRLVPSLRIRRKKIICPLEVFSATVRTFLERKSGKFRDA